MNIYRKIAIIVGVLYIIGTVSGILSVVVTTPILGDSDYLAKVAANANQLTLGALLVLLMALALAMVPVMLFPIFRNINEVLAMGYIVFRGALETVAYIGMLLSWLLLVALGQEYITGGAPAAAYFQTVGTLLRDGHDAINNILIIVFSLGALMLYYLLYQSILIPRWISVWGFIAILMHFSTAFLLLFHLVSPGMSLILFMINFPMLIQELVMTIWLIVKGFNPVAVASLSAKTATNELLSAS